MRKVNNNKNLPAYYEYHSFLKDMAHTTSFKSYKDYLKQYAFLKNMSDLLPSTLYILNFETQHYLFVSQNCFSITGYTSDEYMRMGRTFFLSQVHPDDMKILSSKTFEKFITYTKELDKEDIKKSRFSVNYRLKRKDGEYIKVIQQYLILEVNSEGYPLLSLGLVTDITPHMPDDKVVFSISKYDKKLGFQVLSSETYLNTPLVLTKRESEILLLIIRGLSSKQIANTLYVSLYTIQAHRRNILEKTKCKNTIDLINYAMLNGMN